MAFAGHALNFRRDRRYRFHEMAIRMVDVADRAGVSSSTVSRVLNGAPTVGPERRERVLAAARDLGYRPNVLARNLRRQRAETIAGIVSDIENPHFAAMVRAIEDAAYKVRRRLLLCNSDDSPEKQRSYVEVLLAERVGGIILVATDPAAPEIAEVIDAGVAVVAVDRPVRDPRADSILAANERAGRLATRHLLEAGHERVAFISGPLSAWTAVERLAGYQAEMTELRLEPIVGYGNFRIDGGEAETEKLLEAHPDISAIIASNNQTTLGVLRAFQRVGGAMNTWPALVGFDDPEWASLVQPAVTTLAQPIRAMSERAVELLLERMEDRRSRPKREIFQFELRVRDSCRTAPAGAWVE
jgi:DNA-binding LacI/PurR family transcriptional regulator